MLIVLGIAYAVVFCVGGTWLFRCVLLTLMFVCGGFICICWWFACLVVCV